VAVRWVMEGHHLGHGMLGAPTGHRVFVLGFTHLHVVDGRITEEWTVYDGLAMLTQVKLGALAGRR
jgi:predicted ester cyclase